MINPLVVAGALAVCLSQNLWAQADSEQTDQPEATDSYKVLVYSRTAGFRHSCIPDGISAIQEMGDEHGFSVDATEDPGQFTEGNLDQYAAVVFMNTTGDVLDDEQQEAFEGFIAKGRGYVGVHAAADTEYDWAFYGELMGAYFKTHPPVQEAAVRVIDREHPSTSHLAETWTRTDEWYDYRASPRGEVRVLAELDESTYTVRGEGMNSDHPIAWCHEYGGGRAWYTGGGHTSESFSEPDFRRHLLGGIRWAAEPGGARTESSGPGLSVGDRAPDVIVQTQSGESVSLASLWAEGPVVITFYRGGWCPFCARALAAWQGKTDALAEAGGRLVALTPESPEHTTETVEKIDLGFTVLSDSTMDAARAFKVFFAMDAGTVEKYKGFGLDLASWNASGEWTLPAPGTFVIDREGIVRFAFADWDYTQRADPDEVIAAVKSLR